MILGFKTKINGKPTAFIDKIWQEFINKDVHKIHEFMEFKNDFKERSFSLTRNFKIQKNIKLITM